MFYTTVTTLTFHSNSLSGVDLGFSESSILRTCLAAKGLLVEVAGVVVAVVVVYSMTLEGIKVQFKAKLQLIVDLKKFLTKTSNRF